MLWLYFLSYTAFFPGIIHKDYFFPLPSAMKGRSIFYRSKTIHIVSQIHFSFFNFNFLVFVFLFLGTFFLTENILPGVFHFLLPIWKSCPRSSWTFLQNHSEFLFSFHLGSFPMYHLLFPWTHVFPFLVRSLINSIQGVAFIF